MTIEFRCSCGAICRADESQVGQLISCEACGLDLPVPSRHAALRVTEDDQVGADADAEPSGGLEDEASETGDETAEADAPAEGEADGAEPDEGAPPDPTDTAAEALREQLGGGGVADIAAHIHDDDDETELAAVEAEAEKHRQDADALREQLGGEGAEAAAEKRRGDADALREQLGGGGIADIADALRSDDAESPPAGGPAAASNLGTADLAASAGPRRTAPKKKVLRGHERAAHHINFKKAIWLPALLVGLFCLGVGAYCFIPQPDPTYEKHMARFEEKLQENHIPVDGYEIVAHGGEMWAIPKGAEHRKTNSGRVYYSNPAGFDEPAVNAEDYAMSQAAEEGRVSGYFLYGVLLVVVGLVLIGLSIFTYRDVRLVRAARAEAPTPAEEAAEAPAETPVVPEVVAEPAEESPEESPEAEGEAPEDEPPSDESADASPDEDAPADDAADEDEPAPGGGATA